MNDSVNKTQRTDTNENIYNHEYGRRARHDLPELWALVRGTDADEQQYGVRQHDGDQGEELDPVFGVYRPATQYEEQAGTNKIKNPVSNRQAVFTGQQSGEK